MFADNLMNASIEKNSKIILEIKADCSKIPAEFFKHFQSKGAAVFAFFKGIIDEAADKIPAVLIKKASFDALGMGGVVVCNALAKYVKTKGIFVIIDGCFGGDEEALMDYVEGYLRENIDAEQGFYADAITISPYSPANAIKSAASYCMSTDKGLFMTIRTTDSDDKINFENIEAELNHEPIYKSAADDSGVFGENFIGSMGFSVLGMLAPLGHGGVELRGLNHWGIALVRAKISDLSDNAAYSYAAEETNDGYFFIIGDEALYAFIEKNNASNYTKDCLEIIELAIEKSNR